MKILRYKQGFTLIEAVMYLGVTAILLTAVVNFHLTLGGTSSKLGANIDVSRERRMALATIDYLVRNSQGLLYGGCQISCSDFGSGSPVLALYFDDDTYLPGDCVGANGGGVKLSVESKRLKMSCYPDINYNGEAGACTATIGNSYYLTSPNLAIGSNDLSFSTSSVSSKNDWQAITTHLSIETISREQIDIQATSTATSTSLALNSKERGLTAFWPLDDSTYSSGVEVIGEGGENASLTCEGSAAARGSNIADCGSHSKVFVSANSNYCHSDDSDVAHLDFDKGFTLAAWMSRDAAEIGTDATIIKKQSGNYGWEFGISTTPGWDALFCKICNGTTCSTTYWDYDTEYSEQEMAIDNVFHTACVYDPENQTVRIHINGVYGTYSEITILVNSTADINVGNDYDGKIDNIRAYNRPLSPEEIAALEAEGP